jgi:hypothetical protein
MKTLKLLSAFASLFIAFIFGAFLSVPIGIAPGIGGLAMAGIATFTGAVLPANSFATAISTTNIVAALGAFFRANKNILITDLYLDLGIDDRWTVQDGVSDQLPLPKITMQNIVQPGNNTAFNPTANAIGVEARILQTRNWKVDLLINPAALIKTWLGFTKAPGTRQAKIPLEQYIMQEIVKQIKKELRLMSIYKGVYNGAGTTATDICNGLLKLIADEVVAGSLTPIVTGAITSTNVVDKILLVYDGMDEAWKGSDSGQILVNSQVFDWYVRRLNPLTNSSLVATNAGGVIQRVRLNEVQLEGTNFMLKREPGFGTSQRIVSTVKENMHLGMDTESDYNNFDFQKADRQIKVLVDGTLGVQIGQADNKAIRINDQA